MAQSQHRVVSQNCYRCLSGAHQNSSEVAVFFPTSTFTPSTGEVSQLQRGTLKKPNKIYNE